jgi:hypothetical protein
MNARRAKKLTLIFLALLLLAGLLAFRHIPAQGVQKQLDAIRAAGHPLSSSELDKWYPQVPDEQNRALLILDAAKHSDSSGRIALSSGTSISPDTYQTIAAFLATNQHVLNLLYKTVDLPASRYPIDLSQGPSTGLPHLSQVKGMVQLLRMDAVHQSHLGRPNEALRALRAAFAVSSSLRSEPLLISELVRLASVSITLDALERVLSEQKFTADQLALLARDLTDAEAASRESLFRALVGERAGAISVFKLSSAELARLSAFPSPPGGSMALKNLGFQLYRASGFLQRDLSTYLELTDRLIASVKLESPRALEEFRKADAQMTRFSTGLGRLAMLSRMVLPALSKAGQKEANIEVRLRCARIVLAIERFRMDHSGALPSSLDKLTPTYLLTLPTDPLTGRPLLYEPQTNRSYRVSSPVPPQTVGLPANTTLLGITMPSPFKG